MPEPPRSRPWRFGLFALLVTAILGVPLLVLARSASPFIASLLYLPIAMVPAWSMIIAALGASPTRKVIYVLGSLVFVLIFGVFAWATGWHQLVSGAQESVATPRDALLVDVFRLMVVGTGAVTLVLFVGKRPSMFWTQATRH